ncbi:MAG TPA: TonB-dependent receptor plug domain-containing protein, partial [Panacibacter sp.]|nr:TonB-dependent receptor plug domain-containing protein [Panacibacter sp.]
FQLNNWLKSYHTKITAADIDLLMISERPSYNNTINTDTDIKETSSDNDEKILNITGKITDKKGKPFKDWIVTAISKNQNAFFTDADTTKDDGVFKMPLPQDIDSLSLSLQVRDKHNITRTDGNMTIDSFHFPAVETPSSLKKQFMAYNIKTHAFIKNYHVDTSAVFQGAGWLKPVKVTTVAKKEPNYDESKRINSISQILTSDKFRYGGHAAVANALLMVPGITFTNSQISIFGSGMHSNGTIGKPLLVENGVATGEATIEYFEELNPAEIDFIEVLRGAEAGIYGMRGGNGVISVNTRRSSSPEALAKNYFTMYTPLTYHVCPQFTMPDYSNKEIKNSNTPDPRSTIYWNGNLMTDLKGQASVNFYTADKATNYTVTVTGLTSKGDIIYKRIVISRN